MPAEGSPLPAILGLSLALSAARLPGAELAGRVADEGEPLAGAEVLLIDADNRVLLESRLTDDAGRYRFEVPPGRYRLRVSHRGHADVDLGGIEVGENGRWLPFELMPEAFAERQGASTAISDEDCD